MAIATWNGAVVAEAPLEKCEIVDGNVYFPVETIKHEYFRESEKHTVCSWKGTASYYDLVVNGQVNNDAAWYYPDTKSAAKNIEGYIAFWHGVKVEK